jgi:hypothetical protein
MKTHQEIPLLPVSNWWELGKQYIDQAVHTNQKRENDPKANIKHEAAQAVIEAIKAGKRNFNPFIQLLIRDNLESEDKQRLIERNLKLFDEIYPLRAAWGGMQASLPLLADMKNELNSFLQNKNLLSGNLLKDTFSSHMFFEQLPEDQAVDFFELMKISEREEHISTMEKLVKRDESACRYLIEAIQASAEADNFILGDAKVEKFKQTKAKIENALNTLANTICDLLKDPSLSLLEIGRFSEMLNQKPEKSPHLKKLSDELSKQHAQLLSIQEDIHTYYKGKINLFFRA